jgi:hypothetical protein
MPSLHSPHRPLPRPVLPFVIVSSFVIERRGQAKAAKDPSPTLSPSQVSTDD